MELFPKASDKIQEQGMPKERDFRQLKRNSITSAVPLILGGLLPLSCLQVAHVFTQSWMGGKLSLLAAAAVEKIN